MFKNQILSHQTDEEKRQVLHQSWINKAFVLVQLDLYSISVIPAQFMGKVDGILKNRVIFQKEGYLKSYQLAEITAVEKVV